MVSKIMTKLSTATIAVALMGGATGTAQAQELPQGLSSDPAIVESAAGLSSILIGGAPALPGSSAQQPGAPAEQGGLITALPEHAQPAPEHLRGPAIERPLQAKANDHVTIEFNPDGTLTYGDGCNSGNGTYHFDEQGKLHVGDLAETQALCDPAAMAAAEDLKTILQAKPDVYILDRDTIALGGQGHGIEFVEARATIIEPQEG